MWLVYKSLLERLEAEKLPPRGGLQHLLLNFPESRNSPLDLVIESQLPRSSAVGALLL
jgi:hypothetical protein